LIPLKDNLPTSRFPVLTVALIVANVAIFIWQTQFPTDPQLSRAGLATGIDQSAVEYGAIPYRITHPQESECSLQTKQPESKILCGGAARLEGGVPLEQAVWWLTLLSSMFMHGGILHLAGNMLFLWIFGNNIEDSMGRPRFLLFYLLAGLVAVYAQALVDPGSTVPTIGASGAVAGVLGGYALLHPGARVLTLIFLVFFVTLIEIPSSSCPRSDRPRSPTSPEAPTSPTSPTSGGSSSDWRRSGSSSPGLAGPDDRRRPADGPEVAHGRARLRSRVRRPVRRDDAGGGARAGGEHRRRALGRDHPHARLGVDRRLARSAPPVAISASATRQAALR
jgi:membrane associated rhomboid family serine protease